MGEGVGNPLDTHANQYGQTISQSGGKAGRRAVGLTGSTWGSLKCINKLKREKGERGECGREVGELVDWHWLT